MERGKEGGRKRERHRERDREKIEIEIEIERVSERTNERKRAKLCFALSVSLPGWGHLFEEGEGLVVDELVGLADVEDEAASEHGIRQHALVHRPQLPARVRETESDQEERRLSE
eukprot:2812990-Rhodomonas_salina.1